MSPSNEFWMLVSSLLIVPDPSGCEQDFNFPLFISFWGLKPVFLQPGDFPGLLNWSLGVGLKNLCLLQAL